MSSARRAWKDASEQPMLWATLDNKDMNTSHPVLIIRPDSPTLQVILIFEDASLIYFRKDSVAIAIRSLKDRFVTIVSLTLVLMYVCMYVWSSHIAEYGSTG